MSEKDGAAGRQAIRARSGRSPVPPCLGCRAADGLTKVSAVVREGREMIEIRGHVSPSTYGLPATLRSQAVRESELARELAAPRLPHRSAWPVVLVGIIAFALAAMAGSASRGVALVGWLLIACATVVGIALFRKRGAGRVPDKTTAQRALWLWRHCWYCPRCDTVSLFTRNGSRKLGVSNLAGTLTELARSLRWSEGRGAAQA
jgi:hypothetical protein